MTVNNIPNYARGYKYIVTRECDGEFWFWGAWNDKETATQTALEINGVVIETELIL